MHDAASSELAVAAHNELDARCTFSVEYAVRVVRRTERNDEGGPALALAAAAHRPRSRGILRRDLPNGGSIIRARERRGVRLSGVRTVHTGPLAKSPIIQRTLTLFPLALGTFRRIFFNLTRPAPHLKSIKPKAKRLCLRLLRRDARARGSSRL